MKNEITKGDFKDGIEHWKVLNMGKHPNNPSCINYAIIFNDDTEHVCDTVYEVEDALLIAKAPMMLKTIESVLWRLKFRGIELDEDIVSDLKNTLSYDSEII